ncbi:hypothetical protein L1987_83842 [Smallanthus sonchifolius]|uniref:Uncharacterized protein n=1 Tax=Smallanthus sonchifolius TaxID=185202 RepID=A0ACB8YDM9_9ASTR|nr:hypothetical protein L1987_83842 [Smallanthus sonchifolius]
MDLVNSFKQFGEESPKHIPLTFQPAMNINHNSQQSKWSTGLLECGVPVSNPATCNHYIHACLVLQMMMIQMKWFCRFLNMLSSMCHLWADCRGDGRG